MGFKTMRGKWQEFYLSILKITKMIGNTEIYQGKIKTNKVGNELEIKWKFQ